MKSVGMRALRDRLSDYVRLVQCGERVIVTRRGEPVMDLVPHRPEVDEDLHGLARAGRVRLGNPELRSGHTRPPEEDRIPDEQLAAGLDWLRGEH